MRSFGSGSSMGGGSGGGGGMIKTVHRVFRAGIGAAAQDPFSHSTTTTTRPTSQNSQKPKSSSNTSPTISLSSSSTTNPIHPSPLSHPPPPPNWPYAPFEEADWEYVDGVLDEVEGVNGYYHDEYVYRTAPSLDEAHHAVSKLKQVLDDPVFFPPLIKDRFPCNPDKDVVEKVISPTSSHKSMADQLDWMEPSVHLYDSGSRLHSPSLDRVYDAFHLLQNESSVQRMVVSLSSDKAVWDAIMNNEVVRELREIHEAEKSVTGSSEESSDGSNPVTDVIRWIFANTKAKLMEIVERIMELMSGLFQSPRKDKARAAVDSFDENLRASFFLSIIVLLIVVTSRANRA